jgi:hypothetical protein
VPWRIGSLSKISTTTGRLLVVAAVTAGALAYVASDRPSNTATTGGTLFVSPNGNDSASGTANAPLRTLARAVNIAPSGTTIQLTSGTYRESVQVYRKQLTIQPAPGAQVVFDGARVVNNWRASGGDWVSDGWTFEPRRIFANPSDVNNPVSPAHPMAGWPDQAFFEGRPLTQVASRNEVRPGTFYVDQGANQLWVGDDPARGTVEASDLPFALYLNKANGSTVRGITVRRYATPAENMAAIRAYSDNATVSNVIFEQNAYMGVSAIGRQVTFDRVISRNNGYMGGHGHRAEGLTITNSVFTGNNTVNFNPGHSAAGVKITSSRFVDVNNSYFGHNNAPGLWLDLAVSRSTVTRNLFANNEVDGLQVELCGFITVADNVSVDNKAIGLYVLESNDISLWNNASFRNGRDLRILEGPRVDGDGYRTEEAISDLIRVSYFNNTIGVGRSGVDALVTADDWTGRRSAASFQLQADHNAFWLPAGGPVSNLTRWARFPQPIAFTQTLEQHRNLSGLDRNSRMSTAAGPNPYARNESTWDYRAPASAPLGAVATPAVAELLGVPAGTRLPIGPLSVLTPRTAPTPPGGNPPGPGSDPPNPPGPGTQDPPGDPNLDRMFEPLPATLVLPARGSGAALVPANGRLAANVAAAGVPVERGTVAALQLRSVAATAATARLKVHSCDQDPTTGNEVILGADLANATTLFVQPSASGRVCVSSPVPARIALTVVGYLPADGSYRPVTPQPLHNNERDGAELVDRSTTTGVRVVGKSGIPDNATAAALMVSVSDASSAADLAAYKCWTPVPTIPALVFGRNPTTKLIVAEIDSSGSVCLRPTADIALRVQVIGYMTPAASTAPYVPVSPSRLDVSTENGISRQTRRINVVDRNGLPKATQTALVNVTVRSERDGRAKIWACAARQPKGAKVSFEGRVPTSILVPVNISGRAHVCVKSARNVRISTNVVGYATE